MNRPSAAVRTTQIALGLSALTAAWLLRPRPKPASLEGQVVLVTGGATGLGLELAHHYARAGARLILCSRRATQLEGGRQALLTAGAAKSAADILLLPADLSDKTQAATMIDLAFAHFSRIDVFINCAGIMEVGPIENQPLSAFESAMGANFFSALNTIHAALPRLLRQAPLAGSGHRASIVNISSIGGKMAVPHLLPYTASKFALTGLSEGLHAELRAKGIRVTTVCPGLMRTGSQVRVKFVGNAAKEQRWFDLGATTPGIATTAANAASQILKAQQRGAAEIIITPQAWLAARITGLAPGFVAVASSLANQLVLPAPVSDIPTAISPHS